MIGHTLYVVADDELHLGVFSADDQRPGTLVRLIAGELPDKYKKRKAAKPDLETLLHLPAFAGHPHGALLALGSGSKPTRERGVLLALDAVGAVAAAPQHVDLSLFYDDLRFELESLNIEGLIVVGDRLRLLQRGNKGTANAIIDCDLVSFIAALAANTAPRLVKASTITPAPLGEIQGVPLCFSDGAALPDGNVIFTAIAENTDNAIDDGPCLGAAVGMLNAAGRVTRIERLAEPHKVEGICARVGDEGIQIFMVSDGDDASKPAWLLSAVWGR